MAPTGSQNTVQIEKTSRRQIKQLGEMDVIESPTPWVSPLVVVPRPSGNVRLCIDMRQANKAVQRERFPIPHVEDTINGAPVFSKLDLTKSSHQIELEEFSLHHNICLSQRSLPLQQINVRNKFNSRPTSKNYTTNNSRHPRV